MNDKTWLIIIMVGLVGVSIVLMQYIEPVNTTLEISNMHAEKSTTTWDYTSGNHEKSNKITITYDIDNPINIEDGILAQWVAYDKKGNVIFNETKEDTLFEDYTSGYEEFDEEQNGLDNLDKVVKIELTIYKYVPHEVNPLYGEMITSESYGELLYHGETDNITFTGETNHKVNDIPKEHKKTARSYPTEDMYYVEEDDDYFWSHDELGHRVKKPKNAYVPKWGQ